MYPRVNAFRKLQIVVLDINVQCIAKLRKLLIFFDRPLDPSCGGIGGGEAGKKIITTPLLRFGEGAGG